MKVNQKGFSAVEGLLAIIALVLVVGVGFYIVNSGKDDKPTTTQTAKTEPIKKTESVGAAVATPKESQKSDKDLIVEAVQKDGMNHGYTSEESAKLDITINSIIGDNALGNERGSETSAAFIAHKESGSWTVIFTGQQSPGKDIGTKYNLPTDWYSTDY